jgi:F-box protein 11
MSILLITLLFLAPLPFTASSLPQPATTQIWYAGGSGPGNYTTIQEAITAAAPNGTVYVYDDHAPYYEHLTITKPLNLQGANKETTIIDGNGTGDVISIHADSCCITGFTVQHCGPNPMVDANIKLTTSASSIHGNIIRESGNFTLGIYFINSTDSTVHNNTINKNGNEGVYLVNSSRILIVDNVFLQNRHCAVIISASSQNRVTRNIMTANMAGVSIWPNSTDNLVDNNTITDGLFSGVGVWKAANNNKIRDNHLHNNSQYGILVTGANDTCIGHNEISHSLQGVFLRTAVGSRIMKNDFSDNDQDAFFENSTRTLWQGNFWSHPHVLPVIIHGSRLVPWKTMPVRWLNLDWHPATRTNTDGYTL